jgi:hypothetical protein
VDALKRQIERLAVGAHVGNSRVADLVARGPFSRAQPLVRSQDRFRSAIDLHRLGPAITQPGSDDANPRDGSPTDRWQAHTATSGTRHQGRNLHTNRYERRV